MKDFQAIELMMMLNISTKEELDDWMSDYKADGNLPDVISCTKDKKDPKETTLNPADLIDLFSNWEKMIEESEMTDWEDYESWADFGTYEPIPEYNPCKHEWTKVHLLNDVVYDCKICGAKREKVNPRRPHGKV
jgi:hypothetical protein